jgi:DNA polymerase-3 subunit epsilon
MFLKRLFGFEARRKRQLKKAPAGPLADFLSVPFPCEETYFADLPILSVDFETTGLNAVNDKLLSVGFVDIQQQKIKLGSCYHQIINTKDRLNPENVIIHQITDHQQAQGQPLRLVIEALLQALAGKVMLVHFSRIEKQFLKQACLELYGLAPTFPVIDTLVLAKRKLDQRDVAYDPQELRLSSLRQKHGLPDHYAHNALNDAIATAELLLVQQKTGKHKLKDLL